MLFERAGALRELDGVIESALAGEGRTLVLEGPAGVGKTALLELACERARASAVRVLVARAGELETGFAYGVVRQWLEREWLRLAGTRGPADGAGLVLARETVRAPADED